jgi:hypothetical protein
MASFYCVQRKKSRLKWKEMGYLQCIHIHPTPDPSRTGRGDLCEKGMLWARSAHSIPFSLLFLLSDGAEKRSSKQTDHLREYHGRK